MRDDLVEIIKKAKELGFPQVQIATNGVKLANNPELAQQLKDAGLSTVYLHFDGVTDKTNPFLKIHIKALENLTKAGVGTVLVPTIIKGRNDNEVGQILKFAADHIAVVRGVNFQPVAFTGAAKDEDLDRERITIPELIGNIETQTGGILKTSDFYPVPCVLPFSDLVEAYTGRPQVTVYRPRALRCRNVRLCHKRRHDPGDPDGGRGEPVCCDRADVRETQERRHHQQVCYPS